MESSRAVKQRGRRRDGIDRIVGRIPDLPVTIDEIKPRRLRWHQMNWRVYTESGNRALVFWITMIFVALIVCSDDVLVIVKGVVGRASEESSYNNRISILIDAYEGGNDRERFQLKPLFTETSGSTDYGDIILQSRKLVNRVVQIRSTDLEESNQERDEFLDAIDTRKGAEYFIPESRRGDDQQECRTVSWAEHSYTNCNLMHEHHIEVSPYAEYEVSYLNSGSYRSAFRFHRQSPFDDFVMKRLMVSRAYLMKDISKIQKEATILERLSSSPRVLDIYGHCGASVLVEAMASDLHTKIVHGEGFESQEELNALDNVYPRNNFTQSEKLQISIYMAQSLADIHGFKGGPITHGDTHIEQWLIAPDGSIKLNDFNNAHVPLWNEKEGRYCTYSGSYAGTYRSPEEFSDGPQDESVDTFAFGNNIYTMITGLWPFYDEDFRDESHDKIREDIINGKRPFIDPRYRTRSYIEGKLIDVMERCWAQRSQDRPSIFEVVTLLEATKIEAIQRGELQASELIKIDMP